MMFNYLYNTIWLDCDGVLADFDKAAEAVFGMTGQEYEDKYGSEKFWAVIGSQPNFFLNLELMNDATILYDYITEFTKYVGVPGPIIITGSPSQLGEHARVDKFRWIEKHYGSKQRSVICQSKNKSLYCRPGDLIIDDFNKHKAKWEGAGGIWIEHKNAKSSIQELANMGLYLFSGIN